MNKESKNSVTLSSDLVEKELAELILGDAFMEEKLNTAKGDTLRIYFEDLLSSDEAFNQILSFLSAPNLSISAQTKKQGKQPISERLTNFHELKSHFSKTRYAPFFKSKVE